MVVSVSQFTCKYLWRMGTFWGETTPSKVFQPPMSIRIYFKRKEFALKGENSFQNISTEPFAETAWCTGQQKIPVKMTEKTFKCIYFLFSSIQQNICQQCKPRSLAIKSAKQPIPSLTTEYTHFNDSICALRYCGTKDLLL